MRMIQALSTIAVCGLLGGGVAQGQELEEGLALEQDAFVDKRIEEQKQADALAETQSLAELEAMGAGWGYVESPVEVLQEEPGLSASDFSTQDVAYGGMFLRPIKVRGCWYFISSERQGRGEPYTLTIRRLETPRCEKKTVVFYDEPSYYLGTLRVLVKGESIVIAHQVRDYAGWSSIPLAHLRLYNLPVETLHNARSIGGWIGSWASWVDVSHLSFEGHRLIVRGTSRGPLRDFPTDDYATYYTLTYDRFLDNDTMPTVAYSPEPPAEPVVTPEQIVTTYDPPSEGRFVPPFQVNNCWYLVSARPFGRWSPHMLQIERLPVNGCEGKSTRLGYSYDYGSPLVATKGRSAIAIAWTVKDSPDFVPGRRYVRVFEISPETVLNERLFNNQLGSFTKSVYVDQMYFSGHSLIVKGHKTDPIVTWPFESGSGSHYTATFEHFLRTYQPPSVVAY
jgi:hypothetical protein